MSRCMPWPLAVLCWLDIRLHGEHTCNAGLACRAHDSVMIWWWKAFPAAEYRFNRKHLGAGQP
jgi:hypothetical protein